MLVPQQNFGFLLVPK